jgi:hypothetical protein
VDGKPLKAYHDAPHGAFLKAVRKSLDPHYGRETDGLKKFKVTVHAERTETSGGTYDIEEFTKEEACAAAREKFEQSHGSNWDDVGAIANEIVT